MGLGIFKFNGYPYRGILLKISKRYKITVYISIAIEKIFTDFIPKFLFQMESKIDTINF